MAFVYDAFISYSHRDMDWAKWLQHRLENYRIPKDLCDRGERGNHLKVFRDQTDLAGVELQQALRKESVLRGFRGQAGDAAAPVRLQDIAVIAGFDGFRLTMGKAPKQGLSIWMAEAAFSP